MRHLTKLIRHFSVPRRDGGEWHSGNAVRRLVGWLVGQPSAAAAAAAAGDCEGEKNGLTTGGRYLGRNLELICAECSEEPIRA